MMLALATTQGDIANYVNAELNWEMAAALSFVLVLVLVLGEVVGRIPMAALVAVMIVISAATFDWRKQRRLGRQFPPR